MGVVSLSAFGGQYVLAKVDPGRSQCPLSGGCPLLGRPLLGGSKCTIYMVRSIGGRAFVRCTEVVRFSESPLLEVSLYIVSEICIGHQKLKLGNCVKFYHIL